MVGIAVNVIYMLTVLSPLTILMIWVAIYRALKKKRYPNFKMFLCCFRSCGNCFVGSICLYNDKGHYFAAISFVGSTAWGNIMNK